MYFGTEPYNLEGYIEHRGDGSNMYRGETFGQPRTLRSGDVLASGHVVADEWSDEGNGGVGLHFKDGTMRVVAARIPLLLAGSTSGKYPCDLEVGDILETGDVVLAPPKKLDPKGIMFEAHRSEVEVLINGGLSGASIGMPEDLMLALHSTEVYPPSTETMFGQFVVKKVLSMGATARKNLPQYGRLDDQPEPERIASVLDTIEILRTTAQAERDAYAYQNIINLLKEQCEQLKGVELKITGRLHGRRNTKISPDNPLSWVEDMIVVVTSASVNTYDGHGGLVTQHQPFIEFYGQTVEGDEFVSAWIGVGSFGVTVEVPNAQSKLD